MASSNIPKPLINLLIIIHTLFCITSNTSYALPNHKIRLSTIAAEPSVLPYPNSPLSSPSTSSALSPDITPLFPTTPKSASTPPSSDSSSLPLIPASPSPPNPDDSLSTPHPQLSISPNAMPESSAFPLSLCFLLNSAMLVLISFVCC